VAGYYAEWEGAGGCKEGVCGLKHLKRRNSADVVQKHLSTAYDNGLKGTKLTEREPCLRDVRTAMFLILRVAGHRKWRSTKS
jgi:hypothetical protein